MSMTPRQTELVQSTFRIVQPMAATTAELFYKKLFEIQPGTVALFKGSIKEQQHKFMQVLAVAVGGMSNLPTLVPIVQQLGVRHGRYGVVPAHYDSARDALLWTLALVLQEKYTEEVREAWASAYAMLAGVMKEASSGQP